jgi:hypothetical protein
MMLTNFSSKIHMQEDILYAINMQYFHSPLFFRKSGEPLTWRLVEEFQVPAEAEAVGKSAPTPPNRHHLPLASRMSDTSSQPDSRIEFIGTEAKVHINTSGASGLGCW